MIYEDLEPRKRAVIDYIEKVTSAKSEIKKGVFSGSSWPVNFGPFFTEEEWAEIDRLCSYLYVNHDKLGSLLRSQMMSGNVQGAIKVVRGCRSQKFNGWGYLLISPITVPLALVSFILKAPLRIYWWIVRNA